MSATIPIRESELDFDHGTFDAAAFTNMTMMNQRSLASVMDAALLAPDATRDKVRALCHDVIRYRFASAVVQPSWVATAVSALAGTGIPVVATIGYPFGASLASTMRHEAASVIRLGARELDMVIPVGQLKSGNYIAVEHAIHTVAQVAHHHGAVLKVALEISILSVQEKLRASEIAIHAGADYIKTTSGFGSVRATAADVALLRGVAGARCGICAAGGVRSLTDARNLLEAGANRICTSAAASILKELDAV